MATPYESPFLRSVTRQPDYVPDAEIWGVLLVLKERTEKEKPATSIYYAAKGGSYTRRKSEAAIFFTQQALLDAKAAALGTDGVLAADTFLLQY